MRRSRFDKTVPPPTPSITLHLAPSQTTNSLFFLLPHMPPSLPHARFTHPVARDAGYDKVITRILYEIAVRQSIRILRTYHKIRYMFSGYEIGHAIWLRCRVITRLYRTRRNPITLDANKGRCTDSKLSRACAATRGRALTTK